MNCRRCTYLGAYDLTGAFSNIIEESEAIEYDDDDDEDEFDDDDDD